MQFSSCPFFELPPRLYEVSGLAAKHLRHRQKVGLVRFEEAKECRKEFHMPRPRAQLVSPNSGQIEESLRPTLLTKRCRERGEGKSHRIVWV
jgi:hypothetical protein